MASYSANHVHEVSFAGQDPNREKLQVRRLPCVVDGIRYFDTPRRRMAPTLSRLRYHRLLSEAPIFLRKLRLPISNISFRIRLYIDSYSVTPGPTTVPSHSSLTASSGRRDLLSILPNRTLPSYWHIFTLRLLPCPRPIAKPIFSRLRVENLPGIWTSTVRVDGTAKTP